MSLAGCKRGRCLCLLLAGIQQLGTEEVDMEGAGKVQQGDAGEDTKQVCDMLLRSFPCDSEVFIENRFI